MSALTREMVLESSSALPAFPPTLRRLLDTIDDPEANLNDLAEQIQYDPLIASRVMARANSVLLHSRHPRPIEDLQIATSMVGMEAVRNIAMACSFASLCGDEGARVHGGFVRHSLSVSACAKELAAHSHYDSQHEMAQIAGLLHDIGHLWLHRFENARFSRVLDTVFSQRIDIEQAEIATFGVTHATIGAWLGEYWELPEVLISAIQYHHTPEQAIDHPLVPITHVAEVLSHALELPGYGVNRVSHLSAQACRRLGLTWDAASHGLFGRIEARSHFAEGHLG